MSWKTRFSRPLTQGPDPVTSFKFSADGKNLAWLTRSVAPAGGCAPSLYDQLHFGDAGVVVNHHTVRLYDFINPRHCDNQTGRPTLWVKRSGQAEFRVDAPGKVKSYSWSPDHAKLSIVYAADSAAAEPDADVYTSVGVYDITTREFRVIAAAQNFDESKIAEYYLGGEWSADSEYLLLRRITQTHLWRRRAQWSLAPSDPANNVNAAEIVWRQFDLHSAGAGFIQVGDRLLVNGIYKARHGVFELTPSGIRQSSWFEGVDGAVKLATFSGDYRAAAFVNESFNRPPEVFVWRADGDVRQITRLNEALSGRQTPRLRALSWNGQDGTAVQGWLLEPPQTAEVRRPYPMVVFVHGGPSMPMTDSFAQYYQSNGGIWPYPLEVLAMNGIAVFIPNYRGTRSFGNYFANPDRSDDQPAHDISLGIDHLINEGKADPDRLAIAGHSHGAWLGALVMTRRKDFVAASFAEGPQNNLLNYIFSPAYLYEDGYHKLWGDSLYAAPEKYIETSPVFSFKSLKTAALFESGVNYQAIVMMESPKAAALAGMPTEFVVYPKTGHNIRIPSLQLESAQRNLDWFLYWLSDVKDPDMTKQAQYRRWDQLPR